MRRTPRPRPSDICWRESKGCYYTTINGRQKRLAETLTESKTKRQRFLRGTAAGAADPGLCFSRLADKFLENSQAENEPETFHIHQLFLQAFVDFVGKRRLVSRLCEADLDEWCRQHPEWNENSFSVA